MDQKDANIQNNNQDVHKVKKLASAAELRGSKSGSSAGDKPKKGSGKMWLSLVAMVVVLVVAVGVYFAASGFKPAEEEQITPNETMAPLTTYKLIARMREEVLSATIQVQGEEAYTITNTVTYTGEGEKAAASYQYGIEGVPNFNLNTSMASSIIGFAANLVATELIETDVTDFSIYGLDNPTLTFTVNYAGGTQDVLLFGKKAPTGSSYYVCRQGENSVYLIGAAYATLHTTLNELAVVNMPVVISDPSAIVSFLIEQKGKETIEVVYDAETTSTFSVGNMKMVQPVKYDTNIDRVPEIMNALAALTIDVYAGEKSMLPDAGLDDPRAKISVADVNGNVLNYTVGNYKDAGSVYVQVDDSETVYLAEASTLAFLNNVTVNYLINQFTNLVNILRVEELTITAGDNTYVMAIEREPDMDESGNQKKDNYGNPATIDSYYFNGQIATEERFKEMYIDMIGITMSKLSDNFYHEGDVAARLSFTLDVEPYEFVVEYIEYDDQYYAARRDGYTMALVKRDRIDSLLAKLAAFDSGAVDAQ